MIAIPVKALEMFMRITTVSVAIALVAVSLSSALYGQRADDQIDPRSVAMVQQGDAARAAGNLDAATDALETALVIDPRNGGAFIGLAKVAQARGLPGKAIRYYREALLLDPNDTRALSGQGQAMVAKGAMDRAQEVLGQIKKICGSCADATELSASIAKGPPPPAPESTTAAAEATAPEAGED
jgi:Tfp pilus assembly protein PilF